MDPNETMVDEQQTETAADDTLQEGPVEEKDESESLESILTEDDKAQPAEESKENQTQGTSEPGWIKKRVEKAVSKAVAETEARMRAEFDAQLAPFRERMIEDEARELVRQGAVKDLAVAKELVKYRRNAGVPSTESKPGNEQAARPRNERGQFAAQQPQQKDPAVSARIDMLAHQADSIKERRGIDVIAAFNEDPDIKQKVISGEMDFYDVAEAIGNSEKKKPPAPMRAPNGASGAQKSTIASMSDEQFKRFEKRLTEGARFNV